MAEQVVPILMYHKLGRAPRGAKIPSHFTPEDRLRSHLRMWRRFGYETVSTVEIAQWVRGEVELPPRTFCVTFDDAYASVGEIAGPVLDEFGFRATVYVVADLIGKTNDWDREIGEVSLPLMTESAIRSRLERGWELGAHSRSHPRLSRLSPEDLAWEVSPEPLERLFGAKVGAFCYPYGDFDERVVGAVRNAGYAAATTTEIAVPRQGKDPLLLPRINVRGDTSRPYLWFKIWRSARKARLEASRRG